jgi:hypothetical protein
MQCTLKSFISLCPGVALTHLTPEKKNSVEKFCKLKFLYWSGIVFTIAYCDRFKGMVALSRLLVNLKSKQHLHDNAPQGKEWP